MDCEGWWKACDQCWSLFCASNQIRSASSPTRPSPHEGEWKAAALCSVILSLEFCMLLWQSRRRQPALSWGILAPVAATGIGAAGLAIAAGYYRWPASDASVAVFRCARLQPHSGRRVASERRLSNAIHRRCARGPCLYWHLLHCRRGRCAALSRPAPIAWMLAV